MAISNGFSTRIEATLSTKPMNLSFGDLCCWVVLFGG